ncbi:unnamed protein product [Dovyalis caffra]|uniref:G-box binding protein multifunctional mosaic region domain-containing protein n=1 Tax=Dovyalis caffra TaxID=77055 RepID=A0AAV1SBW6_9ROSI|nr:unnamed protein product [Dovyalis caffra]
MQSLRDRLRINSSLWRSRFVISKEKEISGLRIGRGILVLLFTDNAPGEGFGVGSVTFFVIQCFPSISSHSVSPTFVNLSPFVAEGKSSIPDKSSPAPPDQTNMHVYPDWAAMQAYYGPRMALPPYYNSAVASGHATHPYMWGPPQPMMPPYGAPYAAVYSHGGVYAHPAVPIGSHPQVPGVVTSPAAGTPLSLETPTKSSGNTGRGLMKKLKGFDALAMSIGNGNAESAEDGGRLSQSVETEGSSDGSDGNTARGKKRSREGTPTAGMISSFIDSVHT